MSEALLRHIPLLVHCELYFKLLRAADSRSRYIILSACRMLVHAIIVAAGGKPLLTSNTTLHAVWLTPLACMHMMCMHACQLIHLVCASSDFYASWAGLSWLVLHRLMSHPHHCVPGQIGKVLHSCAVVLVTAAM